MEHRFEQGTGRLVVKMPIELDHHSAETLRRETDMLMLQYPVTGIVFDFEHTVFMDSSGIGVILGRCKNIKYAGGQAIAVHLNSQIHRIFRASGLHKIIQVKE